MSPMHANPFDSVNIHQDTRCSKSLGIHWGTWVLTEEDVLVGDLLALSLFKVVLSIQYLASEMLVLPKSCSPTPFG